MSLVLEMEYLSGVSFAAIGPDSPAPDWPPEPDRIFSALVATWATRGQQEQEAQALQWLEKQAAPRVIAPRAYPRTSATVFVPPNDPRSDKLKNARGVLPAMRSRQPRRFPAARPVEPTARLAWYGVAPEEATLSALQRLAHDTAYVGHSASLTRCRFFTDDGKPAPIAEVSRQRCIYPGRFAELRREFEAGRRPLRGAALAVSSTQTVPSTSVFGDRWLLLEHIAGDMPDLRACAIVAKTIRDALLSGYRRIGLENDIPEAVSGHTVDGKPSRVPHLAIIPLPFAGFPYADGHVMGYALIPPREGGLRDDAHFLKALRAVAPMDDERQRRILAIKPKEGTSRDQGFSIELSLTQDPPAKRSLDRSLYLGPAHTFATVTPIALDRHLKKEGQAREDEIKAQIAAACRNIGLPEPVEISTDKHAALEGAPSAYPSGKSPEWMRWRLPASLGSRQLTHAVIRFAGAVGGPMILGAGRFIGIGLCRPIDGG
ncbi:MAG: CRISPR-associated protein family, partial [Frankiales bacterium]|nr:CRISPR-associated protein family [Frankiales bacterium]